MKIKTVGESWKEKVGSKTEAWFTVDVVAENEEEKNLLTSRNTKVSAERTILSGYVRFRITVENECRPPYFVSKAEK